MIHAGSLVSDAGRKIAKIEYDNLNNPVRIQFTNGSVTKYVYSATGEKLRVIYQTSVYPENAEIVEIGKTKELSKAEEKCTETVDYLLGGALTLRNGVIDKYQFEEGYCQATPLYWEGKPFAETFTFCYYDQDHLGNIRQVTMDDGGKQGEVIQRMNYYPFGAEFCDNSTKSYVQNHKYNGKEFDNMHGLNTYDYGARQYNPVTGRWDRMDPLCEKYYSTSPYAYCRNNPIMRIDVDGLYDTLQISTNTQYQVITVFQAKEQRDDIMDHDFNVAKGKGLPMIVAENAADFKNALIFLKENKIQFDGIVIESHGNVEGFYLGKTFIDNSDKMKGMKTLKNKNIFLYACDVGNNKKLIENIAKETSSTVIAPNFLIGENYQFDGTAMNKKQSQDYSLSRKRDPAITVKNVSITKNKGITWQWTNNKQPTWW